MSRTPTGRARGASRAALGATLAAALAATSALAAAPSAAAPTCWDRAGHSVKCGAPAALPIGQDLSPEQDLARQVDTPDPEPRTLLGLALVIVGLFALIGLMPDFDGWNPGERRDGRPRDD